MIVEPFELKGLTISDCYAIEKGEMLIINFTNGLQVQIANQWTEDEISGAKVLLSELSIFKGG